MWQRLTWYDLRVIGHYLGVLLLFYSLALLVPVVTALIYQEWEPACRYVFAIGISLVCGGLLRFLRINPARLNRQQALVVTGLAWIVLALVSAVPLYYSGHYATVLDALFDGVSGLTTTGASVIQDLDHLSYADNMWRFVMHFVGGLGLVVIALSLGLFGKRAGATLYTSEARSEHIVPNIIQTTQLIARIALVIILLATAVFTLITVFLGIDPARAILQSFWLAISGFMTGGFSPMAESITYYHSFAIEFVLMVLMVIGTLNFVLYTELVKGRTTTLFRDIEIRTMLLWLAVVTLVFAASLTASSAFSDLGSMLRRGLFMIVAAFSTAGFQNVTSNELTTVFTSGAFLMLALVMSVGGSSGSTAGGIKFMRIGIIAKSVAATIKETLSPDSARVVVSYNHVGRRVASPDVVKEAMTVFALYIVTYTLGALAGIAHGYEATQAIFESVAMASNGGITSGIVMSGMPQSLEIVYILQMWAGRLEFVTLIALAVEILVSLKPRKWRRRGGAR